MNDIYNDDLNDGLDDLNSDALDDDALDSRASHRNPSGPYSSPYGPYGPYGSCGSYPYTNRESCITKELLNALLASHAREISLFKQINKDLRSAEKTENKAR